MTVEQLSGILGSLHIPAASLLGCAPPAPSSSGCAAPLPPLPSLPSPFVSAEVGALFPSLWPLALSLGGDGDAQEGVSCRWSRAAAWALYSLHTLGCLVCCSTAPRPRGYLCLVSSHILLNSKWLLQLLGLSQGAHRIPRGLHIKFYGNGAGIGRNASTTSLCICPSCCICSSSFLTQPLSPDGAAAVGRPRVSPGS